MKYNRGDLGFLIVCFTCKYQPEGSHTKMWKVSHLRTLDGPTVSGEWSSWISCVFAMQ